MNSSSPISRPVSRRILRRVPLGRSRAFTGYYQFIAGRRPVDAVTGAFTRHFEPDQSSKFLDQLFRREARSELQALGNRRIAKDDFASFTFPNVPFRGNRVMQDEHESAPFRASSPRTLRTPIDVPICFAWPSVSIPRSWLGRRTQYQ